MAVVNLPTAQQVPLQYEAATWVERAVAFVLDLILMGGVAVLLFVFVLQGRGAWLLLLMAMVYTLVFEVWWRGQTPGKRVMGIRVLKLNGDEPQLEDYFVRWVMRLADIWLSGGVLASFLIGTSKYGQRLGDLMTGMCVVKLRPSRPFRLNDLIAWATAAPDTMQATGFSFQREALSRLNESDMVLVKEVLERFRVWGNKGHSEALKLTVGYLVALLEVPEPSEGQEVLFLQQLLDQYMLVTR